MTRFNDSFWSSADQADGLRRLFASRQRFVPLASNPHVRTTGVMIERLTAAFAACGLSTLVVDAGEQAPAPGEMARIDLAACIETMGDGCAYLAARGLPLAYVDARGSTASFIDALFDAAPEREIVLLHATAAELARVCGRRGARPVLLAEDRLESVTHAYASLKLLAQRCDAAVFDLLVAAPADTRLAGRIAERIASCADRFIGALVHETALVDCSLAADLEPSAALMRVAASQLAVEAPAAALSHSSLPPMPAALPRPRQEHLF